MNLPALHPQRHAAALSELRQELDLSGDQIAALPTLNEVDLIPQDESRFIRTIPHGARKAHPFKLYIGESEGKSYHVYLFEQAVNGPMKMEIHSVDEEGNCETPLDVKWFGTVKELAFPFNEWLSSSRFTAAVRFYFMLGYKSELYADDPGFAVTKSWIKDMQGACDDIIKANSQLSDEQKEKKRVEKTATAHKPRAQSSRAPAPTPGNDMHPPARHAPADKRHEKYTEDRNDDAAQPSWGYPPPRQNPPHTAYPPPFYGHPQTHGYYPPPVHFTTPSLGFHAQYPVYANAPPPNFQYPNMYPQPRSLSVDSRSASYRFQGREDRSPSREDVRRIAPLRKKTSKRLERNSAGFPAPREAQERSKPSRRKTDPSNCDRSVDRVHELDQEAR